MGFEQQKGWNLRGATSEGVVGENTKIWTTGVEPQKHGDEFSQTWGDQQNITVLRVD